MKMNSLEKKLANMYGKEFCCYTGSGTTAMYLYFLSIDKKSKKVLFPNITCTAPINACLYAGYEVTFGDVKLSDATLDVKDFKERFADKNIGVVVPTHIYGNQCDINELNSIVRKEGVEILEDAAQTSEVSSIDNVTSIVSFGHTKLLQNPQGGGAIFTNDYHLYKEMKKMKKYIPSIDNKSQKMFKVYTEKYYSIQKSHLENQIKNKMLYDLQLEAKEVFIYNADDNYYLEEILSRKERIVEERIKRQHLYENNLVKTRISSLHSKINKALWRYSFLYKGNRELLVNQVRENNIDISTWYPCVNEIYKFNEINDLCNSKKISEQVINLWILPQYSEDKISRDIKVINKLMEEDHE